MSENGCPCKGMKSGLCHAAALFVIIFLAVTTAICAANHCPWCKGQPLQAPPAAAQVK